MGIFRDLPERCTADIITVGGFAREIAASPDDARMIGSLLSSAAIATVGPMDFWQSVTRFVRGIESEDEVDQGVRLLVDHVLRDARQCFSKAGLSGDGIRMRGLEAAVVTSGIRYGAELRARKFEPTVYRMSEESFADHCTEHPFAIEYVFTDTDLERRLRNTSTDTDG